MKTLHVRQTLGYRAQHRITTSTITYGAQHRVYPKFFDVSTLRSPREASSKSHKHCSCATWSCTRLQRELGSGQVMTLTYASCAAGLLDLFRPLRAEVIACRRCSITWRHSGTSASTAQERSTHTGMRWRDTCNVRFFSNRVMLSSKNVTSQVHTSWGIERSSSRLTEGPSTLVCK